MPQTFARFRSLLAVSLLLSAASTAHANQYSGPVDKALWGTNVPSHIEMYIALPDQMPEKPPILVNVHSCSNSAGGQWSYDGFAALRDAIDSVGYIMILPEQNRNCWDVGTDTALSHEGGSDTLAIVQMVRYALETYNGDASRVYVMGGSGGGMMTQALLAVYPEVFKAGHARAGVPAGCWAEGYLDSPDQWSNDCAGGSVNKTAQEWGDFVRAINPDYTGPRPRVQLNHGDQDEVISYNNFREAIEEWTNVLGLEATPTSTDSNFQGASSGYDRQFWQDACGYTVFEAWTALGKTHSMGYEAVHILEWFGLDEQRAQDPWDEACGNMTPGSGGAGGAEAELGGAGGMSSASGGSPAASGGTPTTNGGMPAANGGMPAANGGMPASGGETASGGAGPGGTGGAPVGAGGASPGMPGPIPTPGPVPPPVTTPGAVTPPPVNVVPNGGAPGAVPPGAPDAALVPSASASGSGTPIDSDISEGSDDGGCSVVDGSGKTGSVVPLALLAFGLVLRRRRGGLNSLDAKRSGPQQGVARRS
jgi:acetylxylan esterase